jgi:hypothetical protein
MALSKKHFEAFARETKSQVDAYHTQNSETANQCIDALQVLMVALCDTFARENPRFDRARFLKACGF